MVGNNFDPSADSQCYSYSSTSETSKTKREICIEKHVDSIDGERYSIRWTINTNGVVEFGKTSDGTFLNAEEVSAFHSAFESAFYSDLNKNQSNWQEPTLGSEGMGRIFHNKERTERKSAPQKEEGQKPRAQKKPKEEQQVQQKVSPQQSESGSGQTERAEQVKTMVEFDPEIIEGSKDNLNKTANDALTEARNNRDSEAVIYYQNEIFRRVRNEMRKGQADAVKNMALFWIPALTGGVAGGIAGGAIAGARIGALAFEGFVGGSVSTGTTQVIRAGTGETPMTEGEVADAIALSILIPVAIGGAGRVLDRAGRGSDKAAALDTNALIDMFERGWQAAVEDTLSGRRPVISIQAAKEFVKGAKKARSPADRRARAEILRRWMIEKGGRIGAAASESDVLAAEMAVGRMSRIIDRYSKRVLHTEDARVLLSAEREGISLLTEDDKIHGAASLFGLRAERYRK